MYETIDTELARERGGFEALPAIGPRLGIVGGGQLARLTAMAALELGCDVVVLERNRVSPAATLATHSLVGDWDRAETLLDLARRVDVVTLENEFVSAAHLAVLEERGHVVLPTPRTVALVQDKFVQKQTLRGAGLPVPALRAVSDPTELGRVADELGLPLLLKARRNAYDGKGNVTVRARSELVPAWNRLGGAEGRTIFAEAFCDFEAELAVMITRGRGGELACYPVVETVQRDHICHLVRAPARVAPGIAAGAVEVARRAVEALGAVGSFGVEMFLTRSGEILVNELAPRVHNSGHYTIEACVCSQFENHVRAVLGLPLGSPRLVAPAAVMVNLLGTTRAPGRPLGLERALAVPGASVHLYGKVVSGAGRKMGHVTALGATLAEAEDAALRCAAEIRFGGDDPARPGA
jgi:5-(carboxyamino)imidazole ribonucleotide synthase